MRPEELPPRSELHREFDELLDQYEELVEAVHGYRLRTWGDIHEITLARIGILLETEARMKGMEG